MLVSAAIEPYRKSYGNARSSSATTPGSIGSDRRTASPRYTCVPGVHAYAARGSRTRSRSTVTARPARRSAADRPRHGIARLDAQPAALPANRLAQVAKLVLYEAVDPIARLAHGL